MADPEGNEPFVMLTGPWGRVAIQPSKVTSLRGDAARDSPTTHIGLPSGEVPVEGSLAEIAEKLGISIA